MEGMRGKKGKKKEKEKKLLVLPTGSRVFLFFCLLAPKKRNGLECHRLQGCMFNTGIPSNTWFSLALRHICGGKARFLYFFSICFFEAERDHF